MKQTAVEWFAEKIGHNSLMGTAEYYEILEQAKEMEKEQSQKMYEYAAWAMFYNGHGETFEEYWNKNFKSE